jgi:hypothetical protein
MNFCADDVLRIILGQLTSLEVGQKILNQELRDRLPEHFLTKSPTQLGLEQREFVRANNMHRIFIPVNAAAVLTDHENNMLKLMDENSLQEFICGKLQILVKGRVVAISENDPWIETASKSSQTKLKPDALIINKAFLKEKCDTGQLLRGIPAHKSLYLGTDLIDFKKENSSVAFGELVNHLQNLEANAVGFTRKDLFVVKGALAHEDGIELVTVSRGNVLCLESILWTAGGSAARISEFFESEKNPIALALNDLLEISKLKLYDSCKARFLGAGETGTVFWVDSSKNVRRGMALKVAVGTNNVLRLKWEFQNNLMVAVRAADVIVKATEIFVSRKTGSAGLLMDEVGREFESMELDRAFAALASLHKAGFSHGDARRQNLLHCSKTLKWCDLQCTEDVSKLGNEVKAINFSQDISTLLRSFGKELDNALNKDLLDKYVSDVSMDNLIALVEKSPSCSCDGSDGGFNAISGGVRE